MKYSENLRNAKKLIEDPTKWCQGTFARTADGQATYVADEQACSFCALGAVRRYRGGRSGSAEDYLEHAMMQLEPDFGCCVGDFNDVRSHGDVMRMFDKAIELAEKDEQKGVVHAS